MRAMRYTGLESEAFGICNMSKMKATQKYGEYTYVMATSGKSGTARLARHLQPARDISRRDCDVVPGIIGKRK